MSQDKRRGRVHVSCSYTSVFEILMYAIVYTRPDTTHALGGLRKYMSKIGKENLTILKKGVIFLWKFRLFNFLPRKTYTKQCDRHTGYCRCKLS